MVRVVKKAGERRCGIVAAGRVIFLTKGYENTTIQDVMRELGIAKGTTYHYFRSKGELLEAVIQDMVKVIVQGCEEGVFQVEDPLESAEILLAGIQFVTDIGCYPWSEADLARRVKTIFRLIERVLGTPKSSLICL